MNTKKTTFLLVLSFLIIYVAHAQLPYKRTSSIYIDDIKSMTQSNGGMIWIGTNNGLIRYNGTFYFKYTKDVDEHSLPDNFVNSLIIDHSGTTWISTNGGICKHIYEAGFELEEQIRSYMPTYGMAEKDSLHLVVSTDKGLELFNKKEMKRALVLEDEDLTRSNTVHIAQSGIIAINRLSYQHICFVSKDLKEVKKVKTRQIPTRITSDTQGNFWYSDNEGLHYINGQKLVETELPSWMSSLKGKRIFLLDFKNNYLYVGVNNYDVYRCDINTQEMELLKYDFMNEHFSNAFIDDNEGIWFKNNENYELEYHPQKSMYFSLPSALNQFTNEHHGVYTFLKANDSIYWLVTKDRNMIQYNSNARKSTIFNESKVTRNARIGIAMQDLLYCYNGDTNILSELQVKGNQFTAKREFFCNRPIMDMQTDRKNIVWVVYTDSLFCITPNTHYSMPYPANTEMRTGYYDEKDKQFYLISLDKGIFKLEKNHTFTQIFDNTKYGVTNSKYFFIDHNGDYWIGTISNGLYKYSPKEDHVTYYNTQNGLTDNSIVQIMESKGFVLVATLNGLNAIDTENGKVHKLYFGKSKQRNDYIAGGGFVATDESVYLASDGGIIHFDPLILEQAKETNLYIESINVENQVIGWVNSQNVLSTSRQANTKVLHLKHNQNFLEITFCGIDFENSENLIYSYRLKGLSNKWVQTTNNFASYSKLPAGKYTFEARVMNESNEWSEPVSFTFEIHPPFWWTIWAKILYIILFIASIVFGVILYIRWQMNKNTIKFMEQDSLVNKRMSEMKINFFTNISHEFRTPLTLITSPLKQLKNEQIQDERNFLFSIIERNVQKMLRLTEELLEYNRRESVQLQLDLSYADLGEYVKETVNIFQFNAETKGITIHADEVNSLECSFDAAKVNDILSNLLTNAIKYSPRRRDITVKMREISGNSAQERYSIGTECYEKYIEIAVLDQGMGISDEQKAQIFTRYERTKNAEQLTDVQGFGIGLHYTKQLLDFLEGDIKVKDNHPSGSVFSFIIPYFGREDSHYESQNAILAAQTQTAKSPKYKDKKVLIVEDDIDMRLYLERLLNVYYHVVSLSNGQDCLDYLKNDQADLIICDRMMPVMDGDTLCQELRANEDNNNLPIIMLTAKTDKVSKIQGLNLGVDAYITKPFDMDYLIANINNLLDRRAKLQNHILNLTSTSLANKEDNEIIQTITSKDEKFLKELYALIDLHLHEPDFKINDLFTEMSMSRTKFYNKIKSLTGNNPSHLYNTYRMNKALELLKSKEYNISEIADKTGFSTLASFSRAFKDYFGIAPTKY